MPRKLSEYLQDGWNWNFVAFCFLGSCSNRFESWIMPSEEDERGKVSGEGFGDEDALQETSSSFPERLITFISLLSILLYYLRVSF